MMYTDTWAGDLSQFAPKNNGRSAHNRDSSLSSLGSLGPSSPFTFNSSNPQIAVNDASDYQGLAMHDDQSFQLAAKGPSGVSHDAFFTNYPYSSDNTSVQDYASMLAPQKHRADRTTGGGLLPPPDFSNGGSRPGSVASSVASDSPATPAAPEPAESEEVKRRKTGENFFLTELLNIFDEHSDSYVCDSGMPTVPKLDRTMTDIFGDELYNPNFQFTAAPPAQPSQSVASPTNEMFAQRIQAANNQHLSATTTQAPMSTVNRGRSPFRNGSPLAPKPSNDFSPPVSSNMRFNTAQHMREQKKQEETVQALRHITQTQNSGTPQTISPKDAILEFNDDDPSNNFPLFPQQQASGFNASQMSKATNQANNFNNLALDTNFDNYLTSQLSASQLSNGMPLPQQYPFVAKQSQPPSLPSATSFSMSSRMESSCGSPSSVASSSPQRPDHVGAEGGTYTCTYHGCTQRFETPALLQKHKREGHRQAHGLNALRRPEVSPTGGNFFNTQAGPHKCERINPSTGKPCNTIFSRPYDLTRHEDTIHNGRKQKVRCDVCTEEKTFSRADALTRHYRVCHPDLEFPGKHRKRGGAIN
ncbi:hypothetical protein N0V82_002989 [Gnomoniopsis sp. IMI 355080]|nr:hypothetical protein N0V82_002989 [Gnomoniopsis sp. IMI 355080]